MEPQGEKVPSEQVHIHPLVGFAVHRRVTMSMILIGILVLGVLALNRLPLEFLPAISSSSIWVTVPYPSSSPNEVDRLIVQPLEESFGTLNNLDRLSSKASADSGEVSLEFRDGTDMDLAAVEVRDRVDRVRHLLPSGVRQVRMRRFQSSDIPTLRFHLSAPWEPDRLYDFAERVVQQRLERIDGVGQVRIDGLRQKQVQVELDADRMAAHSIDVREISTLLRQNHLDLSAGFIKEGGRKLTVRFLGQLEDLEEIRSLSLGTSGLKLADVARISHEFPTQESFNYLNGTEAMTVALYKASTANLLEVVDRAKEEIDSLLADPTYQGLDMRVYHDSSMDVRKGLSQLRDAGFVGGGLAILAVFLFLRRVRTTLLVGIAIPVSVIFTFVIMFLIRQAGWAELTLNVVSLMGLVLALGMLLDNSIVVIEAIFRRLTDLGEDAATAAARGASEVALPISASTATSLCVFIPIIFLGGGGGFFARYLHDIGFTVCIVLVASLLVALTVVPMAAAMLLEKEKPRPSPFMEKLARGYSSSLRWTLRHRVVFLAFSFGLVWGSWHLFGTIERSFSARTQERQITIQVDTPRNYSLDQTHQVFEEVAQLLEERKDELDISDVAYRYRIGGGRSRGWDRQRRFDIFLNEESESSLSTTEARDRIRALLPKRAGVDLRIAQSTGRHGSQGLEVELTGDNPQILETLGREVAAGLEALPMVQDVDLSVESGDDEVRIAVERQRAIQSDISSQAVGFTVQSSLSDRAVSYLKTGDREVDLMVRYSEEDRETLEQLKNVTVRGAEGNSPLSTLAAFEITRGPQSIDRENRRARVTVSANPSSPRAMFGAMAGANQVLAATAMPPGYAWSFGRWNRRGQRDQEGSRFALLFAILLVYLLMAALFESFTQPLAIMLSVPFAFIGVGLVMKLAGQPRDNFTELGFILLIGVVVNNGIVLVDHINRLRRSGMDRQEAILVGGSHRLRAILMTAVTTILGLAPMVAPLLLPQYFGPLEGRSATWVPVALVILGGLTTSTFLTLMITPTLYSSISDLTRFLRRAARAA